MGTIATIAVALRADTQNFEKGIKKAETSVIKFREGFSKVGGALKGIAAAGINSVSSELGLLGDALQGGTAGFAVAGPWGAVAGAIGSVGIAAYKASKDVKDLGKGIDEVGKAMEREAKKLAVYNEVFGVKSELEKYKEELLEVKKAMDFSEVIAANERQFGGTEYGQAQLEKLTSKPLLSLNTDDPIFENIARQIGSIQTAMNPVIESGKVWKEQTDALKKSMEDIRNSYSRFADGVKEEIKSPLEKFQDDLLRLKGAFDEGFLTPEQFSKGAEMFGSKFEKGLDIDPSLKSNGAAGSITSSRVSVEGLARGQAGKVQKVESEQLNQANALLAQLVAEVRGGDGVAKLG